MSFFSYCEELLDKYKDNDLIYHIAGHNPLCVIKSAYSYYFDRIIAGVGQHGSEHGTNIALI
jgi:hypothetical protein